MKLQAFLIQKSFSFILVFILLQGSVLFPIQAREIVNFPSDGTGGFHNLPERKQWQFIEKVSGRVSGQNTVKDPRAHACQGTIHKNEVVGGVTLISSFYQNSCYTDGRYNQSDFKIDVGSIQLDDGSSFFAFRVHPAGKQPAKFLASHHLVAFQSNVNSKKSVYHLDESGARVIRQLDGKETSLDGFVILNDLDASALTRPALYVVAERGTPLQFDFAYDGETRGAKIGTVPPGNLVRLTIPVGGAPFDTTGDFTAGPGDWANVYGTNRRFFFGHLKGNRSAILWQEREGKEIVLTTFEKGFRNPRRIPLKRAPGHLLLGAAFTDSGELVYMSVEPGKPAPTGSKPVVVYRVDGSGKELARNTLDTTGKGLNVNYIAETFDKYRYVTSMQAAGGKVAFIISRILTRGPDGLNHQSASAVVLDGKTLKVLKNLGQTSGHSFGNFLIRGEGGKFIGVDLGDNYPRGINLHSFDEKEKVSRVVYTFKTAHSTEAKGPGNKNYPPYASLSRAGKKYYTWSNDNRTYTELGGIVPVNGGYMVAFAGEFPSLDNSRAGENLTDSRNVTVAIVKKDFGTIQSDGENISPDLFLSQGAGESGEFYDFRGGKHIQKTAGLIRLTGYTDKKENASRLRIAPMVDGRVLLLWEKWSASHYLSTAGMVLNQDGSVSVPEFPVDPGFRIGRQDDLHVLEDGTILSISGDGSGNQLILNLIVPPNS